MFSVLILSQSSLPGQAPMPWSSPCLFGLKDWIVTWTCGAWAVPTTHLDTRRPSVMTLLLTWLLAALECFIPLAVPYVGDELLWWPFWQRSNLNTVLIQDHFHFLPCSSHSSVGADPVNFRSWEHLWKEKKDPTQVRQLTYCKRYTYLEQENGVSWGPGNNFKDP